MILCDWCGQAKECLQREIDGREFDVCGDCCRQRPWNESPMKQKGRRATEDFGGLN